jgi:hypothetical protein
LAAKNAKFPKKEIGLVRDDRVGFDPVINPKITEALVVFLG